jgi:hypothetical protein
LRVQDCGREDITSITPPPAAAPGRTPGLEAPWPGRVVSCRQWTPSQRKN